MESSRAKMLGRQLFLASQQRRRLLSSDGAAMNVQRLRSPRGALGASAAPRPAERAKTQLLAGGCAPTQRVKLSTALPAPTMSAVGVVRRSCRTPARRGAATPSPNSMDFRRAGLHSLPAQIGPYSRADERVVSQGRRRPRAGSSWILVSRPVTRWISFEHLGEGHRGRLGAVLVNDGTFRAKPGKGGGRDGVLLDEHEVPLHAGPAEHRDRLIAGEPVGQTATLPDRGAGARRGRGVGGAQRDRFEAVALREETGIALDRQGVVLRGG